jgi:hypothetical protein
MRRLAEWVREALAFAGYALLCILMLVGAAAGWLVVMLLASAFWWLPMVIALLVIKALW